MFKPQKKRANQEPQSSIKISVALVTRNRPGSLERTLRSWHQESAQPFEVVISDDSDSQYVSDVQRLALKYNATYLRGPQQGLYANRNYVVEFCSGTHVLTADDDHEHPADFLEKIQAAIREDPGAIWCLGELSSWEEFGRQLPWRGPGQIGPHGSLSAAPTDPVQPCWAIADGATLYPRAVFDSGFRFYDGIRFGDSYKEFGCLLFKAGWRIRALRTTGVIHHWRGVQRSFNHRIEEQAATFFAMLMFSCYYQPSFANVIIAASKVILLLLRQPLEAFPVLRLAYRHYRERRRQVNSGMLSVRAKSADGNVR